VEGELQRLVGSNFRLIRLARGLSQEAFAEQLGKHRTYVGGLERGERNLTLQTLERFAALVDVRAIRLLSDDFSADELEDRRRPPRLRAADSGDDPGRQPPRRRPRPSPPADGDAD
jgi:transcriptional regulator with XRE-family HTH domain